MTATADDLVKATFSDFRMVKTRKVLQIVCEVPLEQAQRALKILGVPDPGAETWVALAVLDLSKQDAQEKAVGHPDGNQAQPPQTPAGDGPIAGGNTPKARRPFHELPLSQQAAIRCGEPSFQEWCGFGPHVRFSDGAIPTERERADGAASRVRQDCDVESRSELDTNPEAAARWRALETQYLRDTGQMAEARG